MTRKTEFLIIGAGPTGLAAAWRLEELARAQSLRSGDKLSGTGSGDRVDWLIVEATSNPGGLAKSTVDDKGFTWDLGGHVIFSHYEYFDRLLDNLLGDAWVEHIREAWVWMYKQFIPYPFQNNIWRLPVDELMSCLEGLIEVSKNQHNCPAPGNFYDWIEQSFGHGLADIFFLPYNRKVWAYDPRLLAANWMGERVATVDLLRVLRTIVLKQDDIGWGPNARFRYPLHGGTGSIWRALASKLPQERIHFGQRLEKLEARQQKAYLSSGEAINYDFLISTMPLDRLLMTVADRLDLRPMADRFLHSSTHIVGLGMDGKIPDILASKCWMYFPEPDIPFYRATAFSNYSPNNVPSPGKQWSLMCEVSESPHKQVNSATVVEETIKGCEAASLLPDRSAIVSWWHRRLEYGYPTPFLERDRLIEYINGELQQHNIWSRGRFGAWKYEVSNQDHCLMQGTEAVDHILVGAEETTYFYPQIINQGAKRKAKKLDLGAGKPV